MAGGSVRATGSGFVGRLVAAVCLLAAPAASGQESALDGRFREVAASWGVDFRHHHGGAGHRYMVETMVGGLVVLDYDGDGDEDLFFVDGGRLPDYEGEEPRSRLFRNDGPTADGGVRFVDVTATAGIAVRSYGSGASAADYDGDGDVDLYVTAFGVNELWRNEGDGTFTEQAVAAGVAETKWSASSGFADVDRDGDLDLYVANYVDFALDNHRFCGDEKAGLRGYCHPGAYDGLQDTFYRNLGDGTFRDDTVAAGFEGAAEAGLGVVFGDLDGDGWQDLYVANDADPNFLFRNRGDGTFEDLSLLSGTAFGDSGNPEAGMGVDLGDIDGDGHLDIVVTNFELETNVLYRNIGGALFTDARFATNVAEASLLKLAFGVDLADLDNDGDLDLVVGNGHILDNAVEFNEVSRYAQENQLLENLGGGRFRLVAAPGFRDVRVTRGLATGDLDRDGDLDIVMLNSNDLAEIYENRAPTRRDWLQVDLRREDGNRYGIGARLELVAGERRHAEEVRTGSSYLSQNALTLHFGLPEGRADRLEVRWPDGRRGRRTRSCPRAPSRST